MKKRVLKLISLILVLSLLIPAPGVISRAEEDADAQEETEGSTSELDFIIDDEGEMIHISDLVDPHALPDDLDSLNVKSGTISSNVYLLGRSLSGKSYEDACDEVDKILDRYTEATFVVRSELVEENVVISDYNDLGITWDETPCYSDLKTAVLEGNLLERYKKAKDLEAEPLVINPGVHAEELSVLEYYYNATESWAKQCKEAEVDVDQGNIQITPSEEGYAFSLTDGVKDLVKAINNYEIAGEYDIPIYEEILYPDFTTDRANSLSVIGSFTTQYPAPTSATLQDREQNLRQSTINMDGRMFFPGEEISALNLYGDISYEGGYREAGTFSNGGHVKEVGGGICQTTTTLYNAVLAAELEVLFRKNHSMLVLYVDPSRDAMVYATGNSDFKFKNTSSDRIIIDAHIDEDAHTITVNIVGHEDHAPDHTVRYETEILEMTPPPVSLNVDDSIPLGWDNVDAKIRLASEDGPTMGLKSRLWKITTDGGVENRTLFGGTDTYRPGSAAYTISADATLSLSGGGSREGGFVIMNSAFLDGTPLGTNPAVQTEEWRIAFNDSMREKLGERWPYKNDGYTSEEPDGTVKEEEEDEEDEGGEKKDSKNSESKKKEDKK